MTKAEKRKQQVMRDLMWPDSPIQEEWHKLMDYLINDRLLNSRSISGIIGYAGSYIREYARKSGWTLFKHAQAEIYTLASGESGTIYELCKLKKKNYMTVLSRIHKQGKTLEEALRQEKQERHGGNKLNKYIAPWHDMPKGKKQRREWLAKRYAVHRLRVAADAV